MIIVDEPEEEIEDPKSIDPHKTLLLNNLLTTKTSDAFEQIRLLTAEKIATLEAELLDYYQSHVATSFQESLTIISASQGTEFWERARKYKLTSSKSRAQYTYYSNVNADWDARYESVFHSNFSGNQDTIRGSADEGPCREAYEDRFNCTVLESGLLVRPELPWLAASLDGTVLDAEDNFVRNIEIKSFKAGTTVPSNELIEMKAVPSLDKNGNLRKKHQHYAQIQLGMLLSGMEECDYVMWSSADLNFVFRRIKFDPEHVLELCKTLVNVFFEKFLPRMMADQRLRKN